MVEIKDFDTLRVVVEDMTRKKGELGIDGVFATTSLKSGEDWRWTTHLFNIPLSYEFEDRELDLGSDEALRTILFSHEGEMRNIFDLYINNSVSDKGMLGTKTVSDSMAEFALEKCVMVQNGNWAWAQIADVDGNRVKAENVAFLPIYTGAKGEEERGLAIGTENYICINKKADEKEQKLAADFLYWLFSSETGKKYVTDYFGFISPFSTFEEDELPKDPLAKEVIRYTKMENIRSVPWNFTLFPSQTFKDALGASLLRYAQGAKDWSAVVSDTVKKWESEMKQ
jgi:raffinose/stachyose/melibiose transport system substrate-binding protein